MKEVIDTQLKKVRQCKLTLFSMQNSLRHITYQDMEKPLNELTQQLKNYQRLSKTDIFH